MINNLVIKALNFDHGNEIIKFFQDQGVDTFGYEYEGRSNIQDSFYVEDGPIYYGIVNNGKFFNHKRKHLPTHISILTLGEAKELVKKQETNILNFLEQLKASDELIPKIFLNGSCYKLYKIFKTINPTAEAYYSHKEGHWITRIGTNYYDINGMLDPKYVISNAYSPADEATEQSADVHTYSNNLSTPYTKYLKTI